MKKSAFTLIEIVICISFILIISSFSLYYHSSSKLTSAQELQKLVSDLNYIKSLNLQGDNNSHIKLDYENNSYSIVCNNSTQKVMLSKHTKILSYTFDTVIFYQNMWSRGNTIRIEANNKILFLKISAITGRIKLEGV